MALEITDKNFETLVLNNSKPILIDFGAERCGPCRMIGPLIDALAVEYEEQAIVGKVDVDTTPELAIRFGIRNLPTILFLKEGEVVDKYVGSTSKAVLEDMLKAIL